MVVPSNHPHSVESAAADTAEGAVGEGTLAAQIALTAVSKDAVRYRPLAGRPGHYSPIVSTFSDRHICGDTRDFGEKGNRFIKYMKPGC